jgi:uncharacterized protein YabE (DUF348 family)
MQHIITRLKQAKENRAETFKRIQRHPAFTIPLVSGLVLLLVSVVAIIAFSGGSPKLRSTDTHVVIITHDKIEQTVPTRAKTVAEVLKRFDIKVNPGDVVEPDLDTEIVTDNFRVNVYRAVPVTIVDGGRKTFAFSAASTPRSIVKQAGIDVFPEDKLRLLPTDNFLTEASIGERVVIERATPVNVNIYGTPVVIRTHAKTVGDLLTDRGLKLESKDYTQPARNTPIAANMQVYLLRQGQKVITEEATVAMPTQIIEDGNLTFGTTALRQQGQPGKKIITYLIEVKDGKEERRIIQEITTQQAVTQITARGKAVQIPSDKQAVMAAAGIAPSDYPYVDYIMSHESGWCPTKMQGQIGYCPPYAPENIPSNLGYGLGQATPGTKMASFGADWKTSAVTQLRWASSYTKGRYGSWAAAYNYWTAHRNW